MGGLYILVEQSGIRWSKVFFKVCFRQVEETFVESACFAATTQRRLTAKVG